MKNTRTSAITALVGAGILASTALTGQATAQSGLVLENVANPGHVLDNDSGAGRDSSVLLNDRRGGPNQLWQVDPADGRLVQITQRVGGQEMCAAAVFNGTAEVTMQSCDNNGAVTRWHQIPVGGHRWVYRNAAQFKCLAAPRLNGPVQLVDCAFGNETQQWTQHTG